MANKPYTVAFKFSGVADPSLSRVTSEGRTAINALGDAMKAVQDKAGKMDAWRAMKNGIDNTKQALGLSRQEMERLKKEMESVENPTRKLTGQYEAAREKTDVLTQKLKEQRTALRGISGELKEAGVSTKNFASESKKLADTLTKMADVRAKIQANSAAISANDAKKAELRGKMLGPLGGLLPTGLVGAYGAAKVVKNSAALEHELNKATAIGDLSDEDREMMDTLARTLGRTTEYTSIDALKTGVTMSRAGFSTDEIAKGLPAVLDMATASDMGLEETSSILSDTMRSFGYQADEMTRVADILAKSANIANTDVGLLAETFKYVAPSATTLSLSLEEVGAMTGILADNGIKGSQAGTALREVFSRLAGTNATAAKQMRELNIRTVDADGNLLKMADILAQIDRATANMGDAERLGVLNNLGGTRGGTGLVALLNAQASGKYTQKLGDVQGSEGAAAKMAATMRQGVQGAYDRLTSAMAGLGESLFTKDTGAALAQQIDAIAASLNKISAWLAEHSDLVATVAELTAKFVLLKSGMAAVQYVGLQLKGVYLGLKGAFLAGQAAMLIYKGGMEAVTAAGLENTAAVKAITLAQKAYNVALGAGKWAWATVRMVAYKVAVIATTAATTAATAATTALGTAISVATGPIGLTVAAIAGLTAAGIALYKNWDTVKEKMGAAWDWIKDKAQGVVDWFVTLPGKFSAMFDTLPEGIKTQITELGAWLTEKGQAVIGWFTSLPDKISGAWDALKTSAREWVNSIPPMLGEMIASLPARLGEAMGKLGNWVKAKLKNMFTFDISFGKFLSRDGWGEDPENVFNDGLGEAPENVFNDEFGYGVVGGSATGGRFTQPTLSLIGEGDSPEYVIPTQGRYKNNGLALWQQAGRELGVPMFAGGYPASSGAERSRTMADVDLSRDMREHGERNKLEFLATPIYNTDMSPVLNAVSKIHELISAASSAASDFAMLTGAYLALRSQSLDNNAVAKAAIAHGVIKTGLSWLSGSLFNKADGSVASTASIGNANDRTAPLVPLDRAENRTTPTAPTVINNNSFTFNINVENPDQLPGLKDKIKEMVTSALEELNQRSSRLSFAG